MKKLAALFLLLIAGVFVFWSPITTTFAQIRDYLFEEEPDIPQMLQRSKESIPKEDFLQKRAEYFSLIRGLSDPESVDPKLRQDALVEMEKKEAERRRISDPAERNFLLAAWNPIGPNPIPNGSFPWSGRTISIAVHPTNPDIVYVGTAQGGLYRSTDGGTNWTPLMDNAMSLAIGAIAISPSNPEIVYVGTGEHNFSADSFFGVGVYRIDNASTTATLTGPLNKNSANADVFTGRGISKIIVHPTDPNTIFVASTSGVGGIGGTSGALPSRGIYRSTNAAGANPTFEKLTGLAANINASVRDIAVDPTNMNVMVAGLVASGGTGGIYRSDNALSASPTFTQTQIFNSTSTSELTSEFAAIRLGGDPNATFYAATGNLGGRVLRSTDGGQTWTQQIDNDFCTPQCFYDIAVAVDPTNANRVYLGGAPALVFGFSNDGGASFTSSGSGLHVDTHAIAVAPSNPSVVYFGSDGGIYKSTNSGSSWIALNNTQFFATQFMSVAVHPTDANFTIGGTQDNGTNYYSPAGAWTRVDGGDGGYAVIDQNAADTTNVRMYHTYFNRINSVVGYATRATVSASWGFRGCNGTTPANGINCNDTAILFYAPLESGPGNPNTIYYGSDRLYRSADNGTTHTVVSQAPIVGGVPLSAIGISPQNDNVRLVGLADGGIFGTSTGSSTLSDLDPNNNVPAAFIARAIVDPNNVNTAYVTLSAFVTPNIYKTTNLSSVTPTWTAIPGTGANVVPPIPVSAFVVDPQNSQTLYAGTDIGVYVSTDGGTNWLPFGTGLPRVAVFDIAITNGTPRKLRIATHGKGMYDISLAPPAAKTAFDYDGDGKADVSVFRPSSGGWFISQSSNNGFFGVTFGLPTDVITPADYDGDNKADISVFRNGSWFRLNSSNGSFAAVTFGTTGDIPVPGDFDGDGKADISVYRPSAGSWYRLNSSNGSFAGVGFGIAEDKPQMADFDGDGKADIAVFRPSNGTWYWLNSSNGAFGAVNFGISTDLTVPADYDGDGKTDVSVYRPSAGSWYRLNSSNGSFAGVAFGISTDKPAAADYDGDGKADVGVFRPSDGTWYLLRSTSGFTAQTFGTNGDVPTPNAFVR